ncbi:MAG: MFS transporter [Armatimonadetes bacterium]|nr:MFS transporter [Armatimonadota bacterium]
MQILPPLRPSARRAFVIDFRAGILFGVFAGAVIPFLAVTARRIGASPLEVAIVTSAPAIGMILTAYWATFVMGRNPIPYVVWPAVVGRSMFLLAPFVHTPPLFVAMVMTHHLVTSMLMPPYTETVRLMYPSDRRQTLVGFIRVGVSLVGIVTAAIAGRLLESYGHGIVFAVGAAFGVASAVVFGGIRAPAPESPAPRRPPLNDAWRASWADPTFRRLLLVVFVYGFGAWMTNPAVPLLLVDEFNATDAQVGLLAAAHAAAQMAGFLLWGRFIDRHSGLRVFRLMWMIGWLGPAVYYFAPSTWFALFPFALDGFMNAAFELAWMATVIQLAPADRAAQYSGAYHSLVGVRGVIAPLVAGVAIQLTDVRLVFPVAALFMAAAAILGWRFLPLQPADPASPR